ncbi:MAG: 16S rRNA (adenine(1518)-N(6)/adenine(1519)-N(6))-dimethyltransferase RsmA [Bacteroidales bacterium]|nr:16S rRNA (adenine(1518)-N(6)/adenine(1519)-N(6))-dimethyltransferase RsmA [Bacteroidales bacterium]
MEVRAKKSLGQHFLTDQSIATRIVDALQGSDVLEVGPGMGVLTQYLLGKNLKVVEIDKESVAYLEKHYPSLGNGLIEGDFLKMNLSGLFPGQFSIIGNFPYNISSQIFFKILEFRDLVPEVVCMIQKEVAERIAEKPGTKIYGILSVFLQAWYDIEYLFTVGPRAFNPPPKVHSAVIRLTRNSRTSLGCDEKLFRSVVKTAFGQRRKTLRNSLKPLVRQTHQPTTVTEQSTVFTDQPSPAIRQALAPTSETTLLSDPIFDLRPERLSVEDFIRLTLMLQG